MVEEEVQAVEDQVIVGNTSFKTIRFIAPCHNCGKNIWTEQEPIIYTNVCYPGLVRRVKIEFCSEQCEILDKFLSM